jgi:hypothetical protein
MARMHCAWASCSTLFTPADGDRWPYCEGPKCPAPARPVAPVAAPEGPTVAVGDFIASEGQSRPYGVVLALEWDGVTLRDPASDVPVWYSMTGLRNAIAGAWCVVAKRPPVDGQVFARSFCRECDRFLAVLAVESVPVATCHRCAPDGYAFAAEPSGDTFAAFLGRELLPEASPADPAVPTVYDPADWDPLPCASCYHTGHDTTGRGTHYDIRIICPETGRTEATEEVGLTYARARAFLDACPVYGAGCPEASEGPCTHADARSSQHVMVECSEAGQSLVHDVDLSWWSHHNGHRTPGPGELERIAGAPIPFDDDAAIADRPYGAVVIAPDATGRGTGSVKPVKNLGWILRHAADVVSVEFWSRRRADRPAGEPAGMMLARLVDGRIYRTDWASRDVFVRWIARPRFAHLDVTYV